MSQVNPRLNGLTAKNSLKWKESVSLNEAVDRAIRALKNPECAALFGITTDPVTVLRALRSGKLGGISFATLDRDRVAQATYEGNVDGQYTRSYIEINNYNASGYWLRSSVDANARTLIHELGHVFNIISGLGGSEWEYDADPSTGRPDASAEERNDARDHKCIR
jgi:hypothetical protein